MILTLHFPLDGRFLSREECSRYLHQGIKLVRRSLSFFHDIFTSVGTLFSFSDLYCFSIQKTRRVSRRDIFQFGGYGIDTGFKFRRHLDITYQGKLKQVNEDKSRLDWSINENPLFL